MEVQPEAPLVPDCPNQNTTNEGEPSEPMVSMQVSDREDCDSGYYKVFKESG